MRRACLVLAGLALVVCPASAQDDDPHTPGLQFLSDLAQSRILTLEIKELHDRIREDVVRSAERMPAEYFDFQPMPDVRAFGQRRWCTNRNWHATVPTTGASSTDGVGNWAAHVGHRIQHIARELRFDRSPTGCPGSKTIADDRLIPEEGVLDSRLLMVA